MADSIILVKLLQVKFTSTFNHHGNTACIYEKSTFFKLGRSGRDRRNVFEHFRFPFLPLESWETKLSYKFVIQIEKWIFQM